MNLLNAIRELAGFDGHDIISLATLTDLLESNAVPYTTRLDDGPLHVRLELTYSGIVKIPVTPRHLMVQQVAAGKPGGHVSPNAPEHLIHIAAVADRLAWHFAEQTSSAMGMGTRTRQNFALAIAALNKDAA